MQQMKGEENRGVSVDDGDASSPEGKTHVI